MIHKKGSQPWVALHNIISSNLDLSILSCSSGGLKKVWEAEMSALIVEATNEYSFIQTVWGRGYVLKDPLPNMATQKIAV